MSLHYITELSNYLNQHPTQGLAIAFIIAFIESLPLLGTIFPGALFMTAVGIMAGRGDIDLTAVLLYCTLAALLGDVLGFLIGYVFRDRLACCWPFKRRPHWLQTGKYFFAKHGGKGVIIGRFLGPIRSSVPLIAGMLHMSWWRFLAAAAVAAFSWAFVYLLPGVLIGAISMHMSGKQAILFILSALGVVLLFWAAFWLIGRSLTVIANAWGRAMACTWRFAQSHFGTRSVIRMITNNQQVDDYHQLTRLIIAFLCLLSFVLLLYAVHFNASLVQINEPIYQLLQSSRTHAIDQFFIAITLLGEREYVVIIVVLTALFLLCTRQWRALRYWCVGAVVVAACVLSLKASLFEARPPLMGHISFSSSFPSGHACFSSFVLGLLAYFIACQAQNILWRRCVYVGTVLLLLAIGLSRLILGAHWFLDVIAAWCLSMGLLMLLIVFYRRRPVQLSQPRWHFLVYILPALLLAYIAVWFGRIQHVRSIYSQFWQIQILHPQNWLQRQPTREMIFPVYRENRLGRKVTPFNLQWLGSGRCILQSLAAGGWKEANNKHTLRSLLLRLVSKEPENHLSYFTRLYRKRPARIRMMHVIAHSQAIKVLHLWASGYETAGGKFYWLGSLTRHYPKQSLTRLQGRYAYVLADQDLISLGHNIHGDYHVQWLQAPTEQGAIAKSMRWSGRILRLYPAFGNACD